MVGFVTIRKSLEDGGISVAPSSNLTFMFLECQLSARIEPFEAHTIVRPRIARDQFRSLAPLTVP